MVEEQNRQELRIKGSAVSEGIAHAKVFLRGKTFQEPVREGVRSEDVVRERRRLEEALEATRQQIREMYERVLREMGDEHAAIFEAHLLVLEDSSVLSQVNERIESENVCADYAFWSVMRRYMDALRSVDDGYLSERVIDIEDVSRRVLRNLRGDTDRGGTGAKQPNEPFILAAHDLTPGDTVALDRDLVLGFITEVGGTTSHTAIIARSLKLPAVVGLSNLEGLLRSGDEILLDGYSGQIIINPTAETLEGYRDLEQEKREFEAHLLEDREADCSTLDGRPIVLSANIEFVDEVKDVQAFSARGVGLYRTEFAYLEGEQPTEEQLAAEYGQVAEALAPELVIFRTVDLGGDKLEAGREGDPEPNPFLGWRGIRYCLQRTGLFEDQLRALLRASARGKVGIMFPMICCVEEVIEARKILDRCKEELRRAAVDFDPDIQIGAMIEVPSAAVAADLIAPQVDFFSIGTNDLVQYSLAVDRVNESVAHLYQPTNPAILRLIHHCAKAAKQHGIWVGICGEMATDLNLIPVLIGLGMDELSVAPSLVPRVKHAIRKLDASACEASVKQWLEMADPQEIYDAARAIAGASYPELLS
jgi:phosphotransferase system enzyme I (PtsI)